MSTFERVEIADGRAVLYLGDCLEYMRGLEAGSVDAVITDPPYNYGKKYGTHDDNMPWDDFVEWTTVRFREAARLVRDGGVVYFTCSTQMMRFVEDWDFLRFRQWLIWHRPNIINVHVHGDWKQDWEPVYYGGKGAFRAIKGVFPDTAVIREAAPQSNFNEKREHPCQRPVKLLERILKRVDATTVFDPFMGSGTTGVACIQTGRRFIGIEIEPRYFEIAVRRIEEAALQPRLFDAEVEPEAEQAQLFEATEGAE